MILPRIPYHITQRGNRGEVVFFSNEDRNLRISGTVPGPSKTRLGAVPRFWIFPKGGD
jgi:hypothetical protein